MHKDAVWDDECDCVECQWARVDADDMVMSLPALVIRCLWFGNVYKAHTRAEVRSAIEAGGGKKWLIGLHGCGEITATRIMRWASGDPVAVAFKRR